MAFHAFIFQTVREANPSLSLLPEPSLRANTILLKEPENGNDYIHILIKKVKGKMHKFKTNY